MGDTEEKWWKEASFYQIWIRSFKDGNGDGIGDLYGVYEELPYIKSIGVDGIWFSPIYPSPNADYGYDISDYRNVHPDYGDLDQFRRVLDRAHRLGLKVIMDLVINHTSDEHPWFLASQRDHNSPFRDYYIWRDRPNNWKSLFGGSAWEFVKERGQYYLHLFHKKQADLNMDNPRVREEVKDILRFWLDMGVDGFREDVINFISKRAGLPDGIPFVPAINGIMHYKDGPHLLEYMQEFRQVCREYDCVQIGEGPLTTAQQALKYMEGEDAPLDMMISFDHMFADCLFTEFIHLPFSLPRLKSAMSRWQYTINGRGWNTLYMENHDHPRIINRYGSPAYRRESGKTIAMCYIFQQGTPFIYQGQEIGMMNIRLKSIDQYIDPSSRDNFRRFFTKSSMRDRMNRIHRSSRDSSRTPMQWTAGENAGFSKVRPWFYVNPNYKTINVEAENRDPYSILNFYRQCLNIRKNSRTLLYGAYHEYYPKDKFFYIYDRTGEDGAYLVILNFSDLELDAPVPERYVGKPAELILYTYNGEERKRRKDRPLPGRIFLRPYESRLYRIL